MLVLSCGLLATSASSAHERETVEDSDTCPPKIPLQSLQDAQDLTLYGVSCFEAKRYDWALTYYLQAFAIKPGPLLLGGIGRSLHELGLYGPAAAQYQAFLQTSPEPAGADRIKNRVRQLEQAKHDDGATVELLSAPSNVRVHLILDNGDWFPLGQTPTKVLLRRGNYDFIFEDDALRPRQESIQLRAGQETQITSELVHQSAPFDLSTRQWRRAGIWTMGASLPAAAAGLTLFLLSAQDRSSAKELEDHFADLQDFDRRRTELLDRADTYRTWSIITAAVGTTGLITGALLYLLPRPASSSSKDEQFGLELVTQNLRIQPLAGPNHVGLRLRF